VRSVSWWTEWPTGPIRTAVALLVAAVGIAVVVTYPGLVREARDEADANSEQAYVDREVAGGNGLDDGRVEETCVGSAAELFSKGGGLFGGDVESENLDGDESIAIGFVGSKDGTKSANTNLVQDPEWSERGRWSEGSRIVSGHSGEDRKNVAQIVPRLK